MFPSGDASKTAFCALTEMQITSAHGNNNFGNNLMFLIYRNEDNVSKQAGKDVGTGRNPLNPNRTKACCH